jgi:putative MFS transporter
LGALAIPLAIAVQMLLPESPRWLAEKGRIAEAKAVTEQLEASALASGKTLPPLTLRLRADQQPTRFGELFQGIYTRRTILIWTAFFTTYFVNSGVQSWLPTLYVKFGGLPPKDALMLALTHGVIGFIAIIVFGLYADRIGRKNGFILGYSLSIIGLIVGIAALTLFKVKVWPILFLIGVVTAGGVQLNAAACYIWPPELFPTRMRSWATSTGGASNRIASFIAPTAIGAILGANIGIVSVFALLCAVCVIGLIVVMTLGIETRDRALEELSS